MSMTDYWMTSLIRRRTSHTITWKVGAPSLFPVLSPRRWPSVSKASPLLLLVLDWSGDTAAPVLPDLAGGRWRMRLGVAVHTRVAVPLWVGGWESCWGLSPLIPPVLPSSVPSDDGPLGSLVIASAGGVRGRFCRLEAATEAASPAFLWRRRECLARPSTAGTIFRLFLDGGWGGSRTFPFLLFLLLFLCRFPLSRAPFWRESLNWVNRGETPGGPLSRAAKQRSTPRREWTRSFRTSDTWRSAAANRNMKDSDRDGHLPTSCSSSGGGKGKPTCISTIGDGKPGFSLLRFSNFLFVPLAVDPPSVGEVVSLETSAGVICSRR